MKKIDKLLLFLSYEGVDPGSYKDVLLTELKNGKAAFFLKENLIEAAEFNSLKTARLKEAAAQLNFNCATMEEAFILTSALCFLACQSSERHLLNPLAIGSKETSCTSLGQLLFKFDGRLMPFSWIVTAEGYSDEYKFKCVDQQVEEYRREIEEKISAPIKKIVSDRLTRKRLTLSVIVSKLELLFFLVVNALLLFLFINPDPRFKSALNSPFSNSLSAWIFIYSVGSAVYDSVYILYNLYHDRLFETLFYTRRFLKIRRARIYRTIENRAKKLAEHLKEEIKNKTPLTSDLRIFAKLDDRTVDLNSVCRLKDKPEQLSFRIFSTLHNITFGLMFLLLLASSVFLLVFYITKGSIVS